MITNSKRYIEKMTHLSGNKPLRVSSELMLCLSGKTVYCQRWSQLQGDHSCNCPAGIHKYILFKIM